MTDNITKEKKEESVEIENERSSKKNKFNEALENIKKNEKIEDFYNYARNNTSDTIAYIAMIVGLLTLFFEPFFGGTIIGVVTGLYFTKEILRPIKNIESFIERLGMVRSLILGGLLLAFLIKIPMIFIACAITVGIKQLIYPDKSAKSPSNHE